MRYSQEQLKAMSDKIAITDYIGRSQTLVKRGQNYFIKCPFHEGDDTPSLAIYPDSNSWYCFGCGVGTTIYDWLCLAEGLSFPEAVEKVSSLTGSDLSSCIESESVSFLKDMKGVLGNKKVEKVKRSSLDLKSDYEDKYLDELPDEWLQEDMTAEALRAYQIRIDPSANRIVYPVYDANNQLIGVKGRTRIKAYKELGLSKYINYNKIGTIDYFQGWKQAESEIKYRKSVIIFEGIKSCIKAYGWGIKNTVASETANISDGQIRLLIKNGLSEVIFGYDKDQSLRSLATDSKILMLKKFTKVTAIIDKDNLLGEKDSPVDKGLQVFQLLYGRRVLV